MANKNNAGWSVLVALVLIGAVACEQQNDRTIVEKTEIGPEEYEVPEQINWRGEHPDISELEMIRSETLVQCGLGHTDLKEMPIFGSHPSPEARAMIDRGEAYLGGVASIDKVKIDCLTCGHQYDPWVRAWSKYTTDPTKLHEPLPTAIHNLPITLRDGKTSIANWEQWIQRGEVVRASVQYWTKASIQDVVDSLSAYLEPHDQHIKVPQRGTYDRTLDKYEWTKDGLNYELRVLWVYGQDQTHITFIEIKRQTEKTDEEWHREHREEVERLMQDEQEKEKSTLE